ncbi:MAG TPA: FtsX-like permease family protein [Steroidobacteraceae bacterium]|jgi:putative ABC transport system permease protein|nr:FtsX-like permease family protein [Steroidobacteraceae bacterium]
MELRPILSALRRNKVGAVLIALQIAVTLGILCNAFYIVQQRRSLIARPSGVDEADLFTISNQWVGNPSNMAALQRADIAALRAIPGVSDVFAAMSVPLNDSAMTLGITTNPDNPNSMRIAAAYLGDEHTLSTLGAKLVAGRDFSATDVRELDGLFGDRPPIGGLLITRDLAHKLSPKGQILGRVVTLFPFVLRVPVIGVIDRLQVPFVDAPDDKVGNLVEDSMILPWRYVGDAYWYVVRVKPSAMDAAMRAAPAVLAGVSRARIIEKVRAMSQARRDIYRANRTMVQMLMVVCAVLLAVTAFGIVGLTSYWVSQRRRQIGIRRTLGATRMAILQYFQTENLVITVAGIVGGLALAMAGNLWMVERFSTARLPLFYLAGGVLTMLVLGQLAVLWPALRAASVPPAVATRTS